MSDLTTSTFTSNDFATGEARVYNADTGMLIMSVDVHGLQMDDAAAVVFAHMKAELAPDVVCAVEIDQMPYAEAHEHEAPAIETYDDYDYLSDFYDYEPSPYDGTYSEM